MGWRCLIKFVFVQHVVQPPSRAHPRRPLTPPSDSFFGMAQRGKGKETKEVVTPTAKAKVSMPRKPRKAAPPLSLAQRVALQDSVIREQALAIFYLKQAVEKLTYDCAWSEHLLRTQAIQLAKITAYIDEQKVRGVTEEKTRLQLKKLSVVEEELEEMENMFPVPKPQHTNAIPTPCESCGFRHGGGGCSITDS